MAFKPLESTVEDAPDEPQSAPRRGRGFTPLAPETDAPAARVAPSGPSLVDRFLSLLPVKGVGAPEPPTPYEQQNNPQGESGVPAQMARFRGRRPIVVTPSDPAARDVWGADLNREVGAPYSGPPGTGIVESLVPAMRETIRGALAGLKRETANETIAQRKMALNRRSPSIAELAAAKFDEQPVPGDISLPSTNPMGWPVDPRAAARHEAAIAPAQADAAAAASDAAVAQEALKAVTPHGMTTGQQAIFSGAASAPTTLAGLAAALITKNPALAMGIAGGGGAAVQKGQSYNEDVDTHQASHRRAAIASSIDAILEGGGEALGMMPLWRAVGLGGKPARAIVTAVTEGLQEGGTQAAQSVNEWLNVNRNLTVKEALEQIKVATLAGLGMGGAAGAAAGASNFRTKAQQREDAAKEIATEIDNAANSGEWDQGAIQRQARQALSPDNAQLREVPRTQVDPLEISKAFRAALNTQPPDEPPPGGASLVRPESERRWGESNKAWLEGGAPRNREQTASLLQKPSDENAITAAFRAALGDQGTAQPAFNAYDRIEGLNSDTSQGPSPIPWNPSEALDRLSRAIERPVDIGQPENPRTVLRDANGELAVGRITLDDWLKRVETHIPKDEFKEARYWYNKLHDVLTPIYGEDAPRVAVAWLLSQQNESPSGGMRNVLRAIDNVKGKTTLTPGLNAHALRAVLRGELPKGGIGAKLFDFLDAEMGFNTRTVMGRDPRGGAPAPFDIWGQRDMGHLDNRMRERLIKRFGANAVSKLKFKSQSGAEAPYEAGSRFYNNLAAELNRRKFDGGKWTAREAQAVGWVAMQKAMGEEPEYVKDIIGKNVRRVSLGLTPGAGSKLDASHPIFEPANAQRVVENVARLANVKILQRAPGEGAYLGDTEGAIQVDAFASPEAVRDFIDMLGYTFQQSQVIAHRELLSGKQSAVNIVFDGPQGRENEFFQKMREFTGDDTHELTPGYQQINIDGKSGIRLLNFGGHWSEAQRDHIDTAVAFAANATGVKLSQVEHFNVSIESAENDWQSKPEGQDYIQGLKSRGRLSEVAELERLARAAQGQRGSSQPAAQSDHGADQPGGRGGNRQTVYHSRDDGAQVAFNAKDPNVAMPVTGTPQQKLERIHRLTAENKPVVDALLKRIEQDLGVEAKSNVKADETILSKATRPSIKAVAPWFDVEHVRDTFRFKVVLNNLNQLPQIAERLKALGWTPVDVDTPKVLRPGLWGWRIAAVDWRAPNGQLVESYFPIKELEQYKASGHKIFERWRAKDVTKLTRAEQRAFENDVATSWSRYNNAWNLYLRRVGADANAARASLESFAASLSGRGRQEFSISSPVTGGASTQPPSPKSAEKPSSITNVREGLSSASNASAINTSSGLDTSGAYHVRTDNPDRVGFSTRGELNGLRRMGVDESRFVSGLLRSLRISVPEEVTSGITSWLIHSPGFSGAAASYYPQINVISIHSDMLDLAMKNEDAAARLRGLIAHEVTHAVDGLNPAKPTMLNSSTNPRLAITVGKDGVIAATGDLSEEIFSAMENEEVSRLFTYPIGPLATGDMPEFIARSELLAQAANLYARNPVLMQRVMPKLYGIMRATYGKDSENEAPPRSIDEARERLFKALQNEGADERVQERGGRQQVAFNAVEPNQQQPARGPPRQRVGAGAGVNQAAGSGGRATGGQRASGSPVNANPFNWGFDEPGRRDALIREWQDKTIDLKRVQQGIEAAAGVLALPEQVNARLAETVHAGRVSHRIQVFEDQTVKPLLEAIRKSGLSVDQVGRYLWARHAAERNVQMARVNGLAPGAPNNLSGLFDSPRAAAAAGQPGAANAVDVIATFTPQQIGDLKNISQLFDGMTKATRRLLVAEGLEDQSTINNWERVYKHYAPLMRDTEEAGTGQGFVIKGPESKRAMGSDKEAIAVVAAAIASAESAIIRAEKARVGRTLIRMAEQFPNPAFWRVDSPPTKRVINKASGLVETIIDPMYKNRDDVFVVKDIVNGKVVERVLAFNPQSERAMKLAAAMRNLDVVQLGAVTKITGRVTRLMANLATSWNPLFWSTNFVRDVQTAAMNLQSTPIAGHAPQVMANIPRAIAGIMSAEFHNGQGQWAKLYREFSENGGKTGWMQIFEDLKDRNKEIESMIKAGQRGNLNPLKWGEVSLDVLDKVNGSIENGTRLAAYAEARKMGMSPAAAAALAKNLTVNFNRKGNRSTATNAWYMFFNANVQGTARLIQALAKSPRAQAYVGVMVAFAAAMELINRMIGDGDRDEDGNNPYELIPEHVKQKNMIFMLGKNYVTLPLPYGFNVFHNAGRMMMEGALTHSSLAQSATGQNVDEPKKPLDLAMNMFEVFADSFMPLGNTSTPLQYITPSIAKPVVGFLENKTWYGAPLRPEPMPFEKNKPDHQLYFRSTSETAKDLTKWLSDETGGDNVKGGFIDISPTTLVHVFDTVTGGPGRFGLGMFDLSRHLVGRVTGEAEADDMAWRQVPFVGKFYGTVDDRDVAAKFYRLREEATKVGDQISKYKKAGDLDKAQDIEESEPALTAMAREMKGKQFKDDMKTIRGEFRDVSELPLSERARKKRELRQEETTIMQRALRAYNDARSSQRGAP